METSGSSQLITWDNGGSGWTIASGGTLTIVFTVTAGSSATTGTHTNQVTVTPTSGNPIPSEGPIVIAQTCTQPDTGLFDRSTGAILAGSLFLIIAGAAFYTGVGTKEVALMLGKSSAATQRMYLKVTQPQKYMESKIEKSAEKRVEKHAKGSKKKRS